METRFGYNLPAKMREDFGYRIKNISDEKQKELYPEEILEVFHQEYVNIAAPYELLGCEFTGRKDVTASVELKDPSGRDFVITGKGNGRLSAVSNAITEKLGLSFSNLIYTEHALDEGSSSQALAYVGISVAPDKTVWGAGIDDDIIVASVRALLSACNRIL